MMKINIFRGDLTAISAKRTPLVLHYRSLQVSGKWLSASRVLWWANTYHVTSASVFKIMYNGFGNFDSEKFFFPIC